MEKVVRKVQVDLIGFRVLFMVDFESEELLDRLEAADSFQDAVQELVREDKARLFHNLAQDFAALKQTTVWFSCARSDLSEIRRRLGL